MSDTERIEGLSVAEIRRMIRIEHEERMKKLKEIKADLIEELQFEDHSQETPSGNSSEE